MFAGFIEYFSIFLISESKLDDTFPDKKFRINGFKIFRCDRNRYGGGLILFHEAIPCKPLKSSLFDLTIETFGLEFHKIKRKWVFAVTFKPPVVNDLEETNELIKILNYFCSKYENLLIIGDLNMSIENVHLNTLL